MSEKVLNIQIPEYLTIQQYKDMNSYNGDTELGRMIHAIASMTGESFEDIRKWPVGALAEVSSAYAEIADHKQEFHSIIEWNGELLGYSPIKSAKLGEYIDIESLCKDFEGNMHKIAAILYRPIKKHRFKSFKFAVKQKIKMLNNQVENVFDWYTVEPYDSNERKLREESFRDFPAHIFLGAISFFLSTANLYSIDILSSQKKMKKEQVIMMKKQQMEILSQVIGAGGGLFTHSVKPIYYQLQGTPQSQT